MYRFCFAGFLMIALVAVQNASADEKLKGIACRSVHLSFESPPATAFYNEMSVERSAPGSYFMACGWGKGYFGIQELANGKKVVLFSVWDPTAGDDPAKVPPEKQVKLLHKDDSVRVKRFGNEGTGGQSFFDYDWQLKETYRFLVTATSEGEDRTAYAGYLFIPEKKEWKHLVTFSTLTRKDELLRGCHSFVEDFRRNKVSATEVRSMAMKNGWAKSAKGEWASLKRARFTGDSNPVLNIDARAEGDSFFLATGGETENTHVKLNEKFEREVSGSEPPADLPK